MNALGVAAEVAMAGPAIPSVEVFDGATGGITAFVNPALARAIILQRK